MLAKKYIRLLFISLLSVCNIQINATHLVGGEIYYEQIGTNNYKITLKVYRDCGPDNVNDTQFDDEAHIGIYIGNTLFDVIDVSFFDSEVNVVPITSENPCFILPPDLCIEEAIYIGYATLPSTSIGYDIVYQRCCRNNSIINILNAENSGMSIYAHVPGTNVTWANNSSPIFVNFPPVALCLGAEFFFDHSATDEDGDELVYEFYTPFLGGGPDGGVPATDPNNPQPNPPQPPEYDEIVWAAGYDEGYQISADDFPFEIDPDTGYITGTADQLGRYAIGIAVHEYRNGIYINTTYRDFQYNVTLCDPNIIAAVPEQEQFCDGLTFSFTSESTNASSYLWDFGDPSTTDDVSVLESPEYTYPESGIYEVTLIANPGWSCADTAIAVYEAYPLLAPAILNTDFECIDNIGYFDFEAVGNYEGDAEFLWDFGAGALPQTSTDETPQNVVFNEPGTYTINLSLADFGCEDSAEIEFVVPEPPVAVIETQELFCNGFTFDFVNNSENASSYYWNFGNLNSTADWSIESEPSYTYPDSGSYMVTLTASLPLACDNTTSGIFEINTLLDPEFEDLPAQCFDGNSFDFEALGTVDAAAEYDWEFGPEANPSSSSLANPSNIFWTNTGTFEVTLTISENGCVKDYTGEVEVVANPYIGFFHGQNDGCPPLGVLFTDTSFAETTIYYNWNFGDGTGSSQSNPYHFYQNPGTYDVTLTINTLSGCVDEQTMTIPNAVTVNPVPTAGFTIEPPIVDILDAEVEIQDQSIGGIDCSYWIEDHGVIDDCDFIFEFTQAGWFNVTQIVTNEYGCIDSVSKVVTVEGYTFYIPNSFSPNGDGDNDQFFTEGTGISKFYMDIYDRWGTVIYHSEDMSEPWMGSVHDGEYYAEAGVYTYRVQIHDLLNRSYEFVGHINLIR